MISDSSSNMRDQAPACVLLDDFRDCARNVLSRPVFDYIEACAVDGHTGAANRQDFDRLRILPLTMRDVSSPDITASFFGRLSALPVGISPMAFHQMVHPLGELATAKAAERAGVPMIVSAMSSRCLEEIAECAPGARLWLHVYVFRDRSVTRNLIARASAAGFEAITLGLGCPVLGKRPINIRNGFVLPAGITPVNLQRRNVSESALSWVDADLDPSATWRDVEALCKETNLPVIGKGIINCHDVPLALQAGLRGLMVSNHGGRQLDGTLSSIRALPDIVSAVAGQVPVFLDSGVRRGTDVLKALALGADAVFLGRPVLWALGVNGERGVVDMLSILADELRNSLQMSGCASTGHVRSFATDLLRRT